MVPLVCPSSAIRARVGERALPPSPPGGITIVQEYGARRYEVPLAPQLDRSRDAPDSEETAGGNQFSVQPPDSFERRRL